MSAMRWVACWTSASVWLVMGCCIAGAVGCSGGSKSQRPPKAAAEPERIGKDSPPACDPAHLPEEIGLIGWQPEQRANLGRRRSSVVIPVRYSGDGCEPRLSVLEHCDGEGSYRYAPQARSDRMRMRTEAEVGSGLPLAGTELIGLVKEGQALRADSTETGVWTLAGDAPYSASRLHGLDCEQATHVVSRVYVGGFELTAGKDDELAVEDDLFMASTISQGSTSVQKVAREGDPEHCRAALDGGQPRLLCSVPLRVALRRVEQDAPFGDVSSPLNRARELLARTTVMRPPRYEGDGNGEDVEEFFDGGILHWFKAKVAVLREADVNYRQALLTSSPTAQVAITADIAKMWLGFYDEVQSLPVPAAWSTEPAAVSAQQASLRLAMAPVLFQVDLALQVCRRSVRQYDVQSEAAKLCSEMETRLAELRADQPSEEAPEAPRSGGPPP